MCVQCGRKQHTSTFFVFMYSMNPKLKRCDLCMSSSNRTLLFPAKIFFSIKNRTKCSPNSWNSLPLIYPVADPRIIYPVGTASCHSGLILFALKIMSGGIASPPALTHETIVVFCGFSPLTVWKVRSPVIPTTAVGCGTSPTLHLSTIPYSIWGVIQPPGVQPFFVLLEKPHNLCWIHSNCMHNQQVYSHLLPHFRESLVEALQPIPPCSPLNGAKSSLTIPDCHLIGKYSQLILGKGEPSSRIDHDGFHQASFLFYFREEIKEVGVT